MPRNDDVRRGIGRRTLVKRSAMVGAAAWVAPTVLAGPAYAVDFIPGTTCTLKCVPQVNLNLLVGVGTGSYPECIGSIPGREGVRITITSFELTPGSSAACPCGGDPVITGGDGGPIVGQTFDTQFRPGNSILTFEVPVQVTCTDRSGDQIRISCRVQAVARTTGNCNANAGRELALQFLGLGCDGTPECVGQTPPPPTVPLTQPS